MSETPTLLCHGGPDAQGAAPHDFSTNSNACGPCPLALTAVPPQGAGVEGIALDLMRGEVRGETFNISNPDDKELNVTLTLRGLPDAVRVELREVLFTDTQSRTPVAAGCSPHTRG